MRHLFIINPAAGKKGHARRLERAIRALDGKNEVLFTQAPGDARRYAADAVRDGTPLRIYACGGDGTLNEVVNGAAGFDHAAVTNVPLGTGNDFLKIFGPENRARFTDLPALRDGPQAPLDLMDCNGMLGVGIICAGVDARIAADACRYKALPLVRGPGAYVMALVENVLFKGISRPTAVEAGPLRYEGDASIVCICNGRYYGGGFMPVGDNLPDDGVLETLVVPKVSRRTFFRLVGRYAKGRYREFPDLVWPVRGQQTSFRSADGRDLAVVVDGEVLYGTEFTVTLSDKRINFFYPPGLGYAPAEYAEVSTPRVRL